MNTMNLAEHLNRLSKGECREALLGCCASGSWVERMTAARPFESDQAVIDMSEKIWSSLDRGDWLEAFAAHPRIGDVDSLRAKFATTKAWASQEQSAVSSASEATLHELAAANDEYARRFGYIFIVCATGKSADEMLAILQSRLGNRPSAELSIAAAQQLRITKLRLQKLVADEQ